MNEIRDVLLELMKSSYGLILFFIALIALAHWSRLVDSGPKILKFVRKLSLFIFSVTFFIPYMQGTSKLKTFLITKYDLNYTLSAILNEYKGTDWVDGILSAFFFFLYIIMLILLWLREKKASKPPASDPPFKIEARIGNIEKK